VISAAALVGIWARTLAETWAVSHWEEKLEENRQLIQQGIRMQEETTIQSYWQPLILPPESETPPLLVPMERQLPPDPTAGTNLKK
jgi:hypothetical protein